MLVFLACMMQYEKDKNFIFLIGIDKVHKIFSSFMQKTSKSCFDAVPQIQSTDFWQVKVTFSVKSLISLLLLSPPDFFAYFLTWE